MALTEQQILQLVKITVKDTLSELSRKTKKKMLERFDLEVSSDNPKNRWDKLKQEKTTYRRDNNAVGNPILNVTGQLRNSIDVVVENNGLKVKGKKIGNKGFDATQILNASRPFLELPEDTEKLFYKMYEKHLIKNYNKLFK
tara:strand:+ start:5481 stop:5906 length:426 start_codon:yes stop_codon:yes gene_type:complete